MRRQAAVFFAIALLGAGLDLLTKELAFREGPDSSEVTVIDGFFSVGHTTNRGVVFGQFGQAPKLWLVVSIAAVPAIVLIFLAGRRPKGWVQTITLGMILAGTLGNMVDRIAYGAVRDFIKFYYRTGAGIEKPWPLFNLADSFICVGVFLLSIEMMFFDEKKEAPQSSAVPDKAPAVAPAPPPPAAP
ncbi:MAG TPA: signal peptidase II [Planctomycetota bacterium]|nr:signal peptidase II [Planctomycetota bacterium]